MMDVYRCHAGHEFLRAATRNHEEWIPCGFCSLWARYIETVDERAIGNRNNGHGRYAAGVVEV